jgi:hypothetical protein
MAERELNDVHKKLERTLESLKKTNDPELRRALLKESCCAVGDSR